MSGTRAIKVLVTGMCVICAMSVAIPAVAQQPVVCRGTAIALRWPSSTDPGVAGYRVFRAMTSGGPYSVLTPRPVTVPWYVDSTVIENQTYVYVVTVRDKAGNESVPAPEHESIQVRIEPYSLSEPDTDSSIDTDEDGLADDEETAIGSDPIEPDTDGDKLSDGSEVLIHGTDPATADSDGDGVYDDVEIDEDTDPMDERDHFDRCDLNRDGRIDAVDMQKMILVMMGVAKEIDVPLCDLNNDRMVNAIDVQLITNALLQL